MESERWKTLDEYPCEVSNMGRVKDYEYRNKYCEGKFEYIDSNGAMRHVNISRLVALAFVPNPGNRKYVGHYDGNKKNCKADNLFWGRTSPIKKMC